MATLANLAVNISANTAAFTRGLKKAQSRTAEFRKSMNGLISTLTGPLAAGAFLLFGKRAIDAADNLAKTADKIGITVTKLQELRFVADRAGVSAMALDSSMERFTKRMGEAAQGTGEAIKVFEMFEISLKDVDGTMRDTEDVFRDVMEGLASLESPAEKAAAAAKVFGREGVAMVNMIKDGIVPMDEMIQRAHDLGIVLEEDVFRQAEAAKDAITDMTFVIKSKFTVVVAKVMPFIVKAFTVAQMVVNGLKLSFFSLAWATGKVATGIANAWEWLKGIIAKGMQVMKSAMFSVMIKLIDVLRLMVKKFKEASMAMGLSGAGLSDIQVKLSDFRSSLARQQNEMAGAIVQTNHYTDALGVEAWALDGVNTALAENVRLRRELGKPTLAPPRIGGAGGPGGRTALPGTTQQGAGAANAADSAEFPLGGPFGEAGPEVWLQEQGIAMGALESAWQQHYMNLELMQMEHLRLANEMQRESELVEWDNRVGFLQSQVASELESAQAIADLRQESFDDMMGGLTSGMQEYMGALMKGQNAMKALKSIMIATAADTVAGIAEKWGRFYFLEGAVKLAASIFPPNPAQAASGLAEMAAGGALMALGGAVRAGAASAAGGGGGGAEASPTAGLPVGAAPAGSEGSAEEGADGSGLVVNIHVEGHIVDMQKFIEEEVMPNMAKSVGRGAAYDGQYNMEATRE